MGDGWKSIQEYCQKEMEAGHKGPFAVPLHLDHDEIHRATTGNDTRYVKAQVETQVERNRSRRVVVWIEGSNSGGVICAEPWTEVKKAT